MKKQILASIMVLFAAGCASGPKREKAFNYVISDSSTGERPEWTDSENILRLNSLGDGYKYYVGENDNAASKSSKALCRTASEAQARRDLASAIETRVKEAYREITSAKGEGEAASASASSDLDRSLEIAKTISGVEKFKDYWEERSHKIELGAGKNYKSYACWSLVRMPDSAYVEVIKAASGKMVDLAKAAGAEGGEAVKAAVADKASEAALGAGNTGG